MGEPEIDLLEAHAAETPGDDWEEIDVSDTEADRIARERDREFSQWRERLVDADQFKVEAAVFDEATYAAIYKLVQDGYIDALGGPLSTGKEANVYTALGGDRAREDLGLPPGENPEVAAKVYRISTSNFKDMRGYLEGDPRFEGIGSDKNKIVQAWVRKEFANLERAQQAGVPVPHPLAVERNVMVMEYIGTEDGRAKRLSEVEVENPQTAYEVLREYMRRLHDAGLVHGDLSEYNVVFHEGTLVVIDLGQALTTQHPNADDFLERDCENVASFFRRQGLEVATDDLQAFVTREADDDDAAGDAGADGDADAVDADGDDE
jgi:RIO kinase 1